MYCISIQEPYASYIAEGKKHYETRSRWNYKYRGTVYIHASAKIYKPRSAETKALMSELGGHVHPGYIIAKAELVDVVEMTEEFIKEVKRNLTEYNSGFYEVGRTALVLRNVEKITPIPAKGHLGIWEYTE